MTLLFRGPLDHVYSVSSNGIHFLWTCIRSLSRGSCLRLVTLNLCSAPCPHARERPKQVDVAFGSAWRQRKTSSLPVLFNHLTTDAKSSEQFT